MPSDEVEVATKSRVYDYDEETEEDGSNNSGTRTGNPPPINVVTPEEAGATYKQISIYNRTVRDSATDAWVRITSETPRKRMIARKEKIIARKSASQDRPRRQLARMSTSGPAPRRQLVARKEKIARKSAGQDRRPRRQLARMSTSRPVPRQLARRSDNWYNENDGARRHEEQQDSPSITGAAKFSTAKFSGSNTGSVSW